MSAQRDCVLIGAESLLIECGVMLLERGHRISAVVSEQPSVRNWATERGIRVLASPAELPSADIAPFDILFSITNMSVLGADVLALPRRAAINFHDGPLPEYAGLNTPVQALLNGEQRHAITWHLMTEQVDGGDILVERAFAVDPDETAFSINTKCFGAAIESFTEVLHRIAEERIEGSPQAARSGRYYRKRDRPDCATTIRWNSPAQAISQFVRSLDFGGHYNPLGLPKAFIAGTLTLVRALRIEATRSGAMPGTICGITSDGITVATATNDITLTNLANLGGDPILPFALPLNVGDRLNQIDLERARTVTAIDGAVARHEHYWRARLATLSALRLPVIRPANSFVAETQARDIVDLVRSSEPNRAKTAAVALIAYLARVADKSEFDVGFASPVLIAQYGSATDWFSQQVPLRAKVDFGSGLEALKNALCAEMREIHRRIGFTADLVARDPDLVAPLSIPSGTALPVSIIIVDDLIDTPQIPGAELVVAIRADGGEAAWIYDPARLDPAMAASLQHGFLTLLEAAEQAPDMALGELPVFDEATRVQVLEDWNATAQKGIADGCIHDLFERQARLTPDKPAITCRGETLSYAELDFRSNKLAWYLQSLDVGPDTLVGLHIDRSIDMVVALIAIHRAGAAYLPLDPEYPTARLRYMIEDSAVRLIVTKAKLADRVRNLGARIVSLDTDHALIDAQRSLTIAGGARPDNLAYVIYTSGSTGRPKGVMVEHRNVVNFFAGMDRKIEPGGTWLAVTSLNFDISVLELYWTLTCGCHVVIATGETGAAPPPAGASAKPVEFSLFYFASADSGGVAEQYRLLLEGAKFGDRNGFAAIWTPERHFHAFGGLYPNPSVASAAIAAVTQRIEIRGGSVVLPLHHPVRVAEEWSLVDNLSGGRVGIAFASGWQPNDFLLRPENFADKAGALMRGIDTVRRLWRGESCAFPGPTGDDVSVTIYPRPIQPELPFWITSAGNPETFAAAGRVGARILTHLLGQSVAEVGKKLAAYRQAWREAGHAGAGHVTMMLHSFVGPDADTVRETVRAPMIAYLRTSTGLVKQHAWSFPAFKQRPGMNGSSAQADLDSLSDAEMDQLHEHAFDRYYETSGLFGTPEHCLGIIRDLQDVGVDEIACLIDFGVPAEQVLAHLPHLNTLRELAQRIPTNRPEPAEAPASIGDLLIRYDVTHLQCTPSMAQMLAADRGAHAGLARLKQLMVGGEAFPPALARDLAHLVGGQVLNMYGPTETTIWSAVHRIEDEGSTIPLGRPLANQQVYILDSHQRPVQPGIPGEIVIGGNGVVRGYHERAELTAERFLPNPFKSGERVYRTGDLGRYRSDGTIEFLGRLDHQVKLRGHRIELGEIEAALSGHADIAEAIVCCREDTPGDVRLVAYYAPVPSRNPSETALRTDLAAQLPAIMVPSHFIAMAALPRMPNGKLDRNALPKPGEAAGAAISDSIAPPRNGLEKEIAAIWCDVLKLPSVGIRDNFFDLGGHSLLAVQVHRRLQGVSAREPSITDIFRFPTIEALSHHLLATVEDDGAMRHAHSRAEGRKAARQRRHPGAQIPFDMARGG